MIRSGHVNSKYEIQKHFIGCYRNLVIDHYIHICSSDKCLDNPKHKCRFRFPRPFSHTNIVQDNAYPLYQRRPPAPNQACKNAFPHLYGETCEKFLRNVKTTYDNSRVVPHNRFLSMAFDCHCNVELVSGDKCCQYTLEYVTKGFGMAFVLADVVNNETNPVANYDQFHEIQLVHFMTAQEAFRRIMSFPITLKSHSVKVLKIHLPNQIPVPFDNENVESVALSLTQQKEFMDQKSMLTAYVDLASVDAFAAKLKYTEINRYYKFDKTNTKWIQRKDKEKLALVRMWSCNGRNIELYALRALLLHCPGRKIVEYWTKNLDQGIPFLEMAQQEGLVKNDTIWENAMDAITGEKVSRVKIIDFLLCS